MAEVKNDTAQTDAPATADPTPPVTDQVSAPEGPSEPDVAETHKHVALRDFSAAFEHQILTFLKDEVIDSRVGVWLRAHGAPIKVVELSAKENKGKL